MKTLTFGRTQQIAQRLGEDYRDLHERLRDYATASIVSVRELTQIITPSWYSYDASRVLPDTPNAVAVCTSTCKHEMPYKIFVGKRHEGWQRAHPTIKDTWLYTLDDLGRDLTPLERNAIYDSM